MSVPAWPMPIHQTKLRMSKPQPTGTLTPKMPDALDDEVRDRREQDHRQREPDARRRRTRRWGVRRESAIEASLSVSVVNV